MSIQLNAVEARVLGCLIEKAITTPEYYPLSLNGLITACNQKSNRDPVMTLEEATVTEALDDLRYNHHLIWHVTTSGSRVPRYKHDVANVIGLSNAELALLCVLLLRGPQTPGELRARTARLHGFEGLADVITVLEDLSHREPDPLVTKLPRQAGSREQRYAHLLCGDVATETPDATALPEEPPKEQPPQEQPSPDPDRLAAVEAEIQILKDAFAELEQRFAEFKQQFD